MSNHLNTELLPIIRELEAMTRCLESTTDVLRKVAARPWPDIPNGEGIAGEASAGILPAGIACTCGHSRELHWSEEAIPGWSLCLGLMLCGKCPCQKFKPAMADPGD